MARREDRTEGDGTQQPAKISRFRWVLLGLVGAATLAAVGVRYFANEEGRPTGEAIEQVRTEMPEGVGGSGFLPSGAPVPSEDPTPREKAEEIAPVVTEAGLFAFLGFAIGYTARKAVKIGMILIAIFFAALQSLAYAGVVSVDWSRGLEMINQLVMNVSGGDSIGAVLKSHVPSAGALAGGYLLGFRRG